MNSRIRRRDDVHAGRSTMKGVPAVRARCASCISVVVLPRPAGPSRTMRQLCDSRRSICSSDSTSADSAPFGSSLTAVRSTSGCPFVLPSPGPRDGGSRAPCSVNEVSDLWFGIDIEVEEGGAERRVLRHHHQRNDFLALYDVKFEVVIFLNFPPSTSLGWHCRLWRPSRKGASLGQESSP